MAFRLLIECSKDIDSLKINFSDGTSVVNETTSNQVKSELKNPTKRQNKPKQRKSELLEFDEQSNVVHDDAIVALPVIADTNDRTVNVAEELQNLDI